MKENADHEQSKKKTHMKILQYMVLDNAGYFSSDIAKLTQTKINESTRYTHVFVKNLHFFIKKINICTVVFNFFYVRVTNEYIKPLLTIEFCFTYICVLLVIKQIFVISYSAFYIKFKYKK